MEKVAKSWSGLNVFREEHCHLLIWTRSAVRTSGWVWLILTVKTDEN